MNNATQSKSPLSTVLRSGRAPAAPRRKYDAFSRVMHWIFAVVILYTMASGFALHVIRDPAIHSAISKLNVSLASCLIVLFPIRYLWTFMRDEPVAVASIPDLQRAVAHVVHSLIYLLIAFVLLSGFLMVPDGYWLFNVLYVHTPLAAGPVTEHWFLAHRIACYALATLVALHVGAALKHHFVAKNGVLKRML